MFRKLFLLVAILTLAAVPAFAVDLISQAPSGTNTNAYACQNFVTADDAYDIFIADDFEVPAGSTWSIEEIDFFGTGWNGFTSLTNATAIWCQIYGDNSGVPNGVPEYEETNLVWGAGFAPADPEVTLPAADDFEIALTTPVVLDPGLYWISCYPEMDYATGGQWGTLVSDATNLEIAKVVNPGGGLSLPTTWTNMTTAFSITEQAVAFTLQGTVGVPDDDDDTADDDTTDDDAADDDAADDDAADDDAADDDAADDDAADDDAADDDAADDDTSVDDDDDDDDSGCGC
ncbi:MAG: hypothetical protein GX444_19730 [Myxococcales bacterium]|nr:hypothetical protein [Myxococcales bacterium]